MKGVKGKGGFATPGDYIHFKSVVPLHKIPVGSKQWRYYDFGPKIVPPLICIPGTAGSADVYYKQVMALSMKGYRIISVDIPRVWNHQEWIHVFEKFLDAINVHRIHIYGTSLGGFLAQLFAQHRPRRVKSLVLSNTFLDTRSFAAAMPWAPVVSWTPSFLLKRYVLTGIRDGPHEPFIADSVDFVVSQVEALGKDDLACRLSLTVDSASIAPLQLPDASITIMDTNDYCAIPQHLKDEVSERYPEARQADLKTGGDFPFLSRPDEVNLHLQLHLRRVGVEPKPDLVPGAPRTVNIVNPREENEGAYRDYQAKHYESSSAGPSQSEIKYGDDNDDTNKPPNDNENTAGCTSSLDEQEVNDELKADESSCRGPVRSAERKDGDDPPGDDGGSSQRDPLTGNIKDCANDQPLSEETSGDSNSGEGKAADDTPKDSEASTISCSQLNAITSSFDKQHQGTANISSLLLLHQDPQKLDIFLKVLPEILVSFVLPSYMGALYIACVYYCTLNLGCQI